MTPRIINTWHNVHTSFWFVPALMVTVAAALAFAAVHADRRFTSQLRSADWLWGGSPDGAREMLSTIASSMITVAGVTFSVTVVALTMAASQFGPRVLRNFMRDTGNQVVLGTFVSTFVYCLLVLRTIRGDEVFVPHLAATLSLLFAVLAVGILIYFIHHVASTLQVENLVASITDELLDTIDHLFPEDLGQRLPEPAAKTGRHRRMLEQPAWQVPATYTGYVQAVENNGLMQLAVEHDLIVRLLRHPGSFISETMPLLEVWPADRRNDELGVRLAGMITCGRHRTTTQDVEYPAQQVVSIALRALSPAINDPVSAMICIDWLGSALLRLAGRRIPAAHRSDRDGQLRVIATATTFADLADLVFNPIRRAAHQHPAVLLRMLEKLHALALHATRQSDHQAIEEHAHRLQRAAAEAGFERSELMRIEEKYRLIREALAGRRASPPGEDGRESGSDST